jgi:hypothetical protein
LVFQALILILTDFIEWEVGEAWKQIILIFDSSGTLEREKGINNMEWIDREEWRRKIKL